ncbi:Hypothetical predicted protein [Mytilus galloprovincialis]|uniref:Uncharacterized protein n=1 Tax=Mytilus galloprovincialis TaxID=29158 RepID=A0A8B6C2Y9_MYTGA|nr:Hypothetical predicted protein [Mytilus galloprovincialis]
MPLCVPMLKSTTGWSQNRNQSQLPPFELPISFDLKHFEAVAPRCEDIRGHPDEQKSPTSWCDMPLCGSTPGALRDGTRTGTITKPSYLPRYDNKLSS